MKNLLSVFLLACVSLAFAETGSYSTTMVEVSEVASVEAITERLVGPGLSVVPTGAFVGTTANGQIGFFSGLNFNSEADSVRGRTEIIRNLAAFTNGVILSTGDISQGQTVSNTVAKKSWGASEVKYTGADAALTTHQDYDKDLARLCGEDHSKLNDTVGVVLYIVPRNKTINIPFMMVSEEFFAPKSNQSFQKPTYTYPDLDRYANYSDKFAFFLEKGKLSLSDTRDMGMTNNIALLPDRKGIVEISSVNQLTNQDYFVSNVITNGTTDPSIDGNRLIFPAGDIPLPMEYNGAIVGPIACATDVIPGETNTIKIVLADRGDRNCNSVIFLAEKSITSGADLKIDVMGPTFIDEPGNMVFTNTVSNIGPPTADGVVVTNYLPAGASYLECNNSGIGKVDLGEGYLVWTLGDGFKSGSNAVMTVRCNLPGTGFYTNSAVVVTSTGDYDEKNNADECVTQVGGEIQEITVRAITTNKLYGTELALPGIQFIASLDGTNGEQSVMGVDVKFFKDGVEAFPTNKSTSAGVYQICLTNINISGLYPSAIIHYENGELTNERRAITIKANDTNKVYGASIDLSTVKDAFTVLDEGDGLADGEHVTGVSIKSRLALETSTPAGTNYNAITLVEPIKVTGEDGFNPINYVITPSNGTLVVDKRKITITPTERNRDYGDDYTLTGRKGFDVQGELAPDDEIDTLDLECEDGVAMMATCGVYKVTVEGVNFTVPAKRANYEITTVDGELYVNAIELVIIASDTNKVYGSELTFLGTEFKTEPPVKSWDAVTNVNLASIGRFQTATSGVYVITAANAIGRGLENYEITEYRNGTLTVTNAPLMVIANDTNKVYGAEFSFKGDEYKTIPEDLYNTDEITNLALTSDGTNRLAECTEYDIVVTNALGIGLENYDITYLYGTLTVTNAHLTIIANSTNKVYGAELSFEGNEFTIESPGLLNDDTVRSVTLTSAGAPATADCGEYPIEPAHAFGDGLENYAITYSNGTLTVTQALLTVTANSTNRVYGTPFEFSGKEFTIGHPGLRNGDTITNVTLMCDATNATIGCGEYVIAATNAQGKGVKNYRIAYETGKFDVDPFKIWITADDTNKVYGSAVEFAGTEFTLNTADGSPLPNGEKVETVTITSVPATNLAASVGEYVKAIVPSHEVMGSANFKTNNYEIVFSNGTLTVTQALLKVKVNDAEYHIKQGWPPNYSVTFLSLKGGDTEELVVGPDGISYTNAVWTAQPDKKVDEGVYTNEIWATLESFVGPRATNYWITVEPGNLKVLAAMPELKASLTWELNGKGLFEGTLTVKNTGDGETDADSDYWVELIPGPATNGTKVSVPHAYYLASRTGTIPGGPGYQGTDYVYEYQDLTDLVKTNLFVKYNHTVFGTNESVTVTGINVYHWKRYNPSKGYFDTNAFFVVGRLYNPSDNDPTDFRVSDSEKIAAEPLLRTSVSDYLEMTRLNLLQYYHWNTNAGTWKGPSK